jgi:hypothetical protein
MLSGGLVRAAHEGEKDMRTRQGAVLLGCVWLAAAAGCGAGPKEEAPAEAAPPPAGAAAAQAPLAAPANNPKKPSLPYPVIPGRFDTKEYTAEELAPVGLDGRRWEKEYVGRLMNVRGVVDFVGAPWVHLKTSQRWPTGQPVRVTLRFADKSVLKTLVEGDTILVRGQAMAAGARGPSLEGVQLVKVIARRPK